MAPSVEDILAVCEADPAGVEYVNPRLHETPIQIVDPDPSWPQTFAEIRARIQAALGPTALEIHHAGSTSVPGLPAKAVIDIDLVVPDPTDEASYVPALEAAAAGFSLRLREPSWYEHRFMLCYDPWVNLHVFGPDCPEVLRHQIFRKRLIKSDEDRELYANLKREAAAATREAGDPTDAKYNVRKQAVIQEILQRAFRDEGYLS
jgi:GrpB-like predicted nucleotidyltransferase (UPF0157 family)